MRCKALRLALVASVLVVSCSRKDRGDRRIAILPFENLAAQPELDWMGRGFAEAIRLQLSGSPHIQPVAVSSLRDVPSAGATEILEGRFSVSGGRLQVDAVLEDAVRVRSLGTVRASEPLAGGLLPLAVPVARLTGPEAHAFPTRSSQAFQAYITAIEAKDAAAADSAYSRSVSEDPNFGAAWLAWVQSLLARGDRGQAVRVIAAAREKATEFPEIERARLDLAASAISGDRAGERRALMALSHADPADASVYRRLSDLDAEAHSYREAAVFEEKAFEREPADVLLLNQAGYLRAWAGDLEGAVKALERYRRLRPAEANPIDSLGDAYYWSGRFSEAEAAYQEAASKDPGFQGSSDLYKSGWARLMRGDLAGADEAVGQYCQARRAAGDPLAEYRLAQWQYLTGRRREGVARMESAARTARPGEASLLYAQLAIWAVENEDGARAREYAAMAVSPHPIAALARFLAQPPASPEEWSARAANAYPAPQQAGFRKMAVAYALLLSRQFAAAVAPLDEIYRATQPSSPDWPAVPLAWALAETGQFERVPELVSGNQAPDIAAQGPLRSLVFPKVLYVRAMLAAKQGRREQADAVLRMFRKYGGS